MVTIHAAREEQPDVVRESFLDIVKALKKEKITVPLGIETMGDLGEFGSLDDVLDVVSHVPGTDVVVDVAHIYARTDGGLKKLADFEEVFDKVMAVKKSPLHIHFSGIDIRTPGSPACAIRPWRADMELFARALADGADVTRRSSASRRCWKRMRSWKCSRTSASCSDVPDGPVDRRKGDGRDHQRRPGLGHVTLGAMMGYILRRYRSCSAAQQSSSATSTAKYSR